MLSDKLDLRVKILTLPFTEFSFYKEDYIEKLSNSKNIIEYNKLFKKKFIYQICRNINKKIRITNLDEVQLLYGKYYGRNNISKFTNGVYEYYLDHLNELSKVFIAHRNGRIVLKYWETEGERDFLGPYAGINKIAMWNSLNRMFMTDLIVINYLLENNIDDEENLKVYHSIVSIEDLQLEQILQHGVSETHFHMNAGINFELSWIDCMANKNRKKLIEKRGNFFDALLGDENNLINYLDLIALIRIFLSYFLVKGDKNKCYIDSFYSDDSVCLGIEKYEIMNLLEIVYGGETIDEIKKQEIVKYYNSVFTYVREEYKENCNEVYEENIVKWKLKLSEMDCLNKIFENDGKYYTAEKVFLFKAMKYMKANYKVGKYDEYFNKIFFQYIRFKNEIFQLRVQMNGMKGLQYFQECYNRSTDLINYNQYEKFGLILHNVLQNSKVKKLEVRMSLSKEKSERTLKQKVIERLEIFFKVYLEILNDLHDYDFAPLIGIVYHFIKLPDNFDVEKCWKNYQDNNSYDELYYKRIQKSYEMQMRVILELRQKIIGLSNYIVGIDAASIENYTEPWVFAPIYDQIRNSDSCKLMYGECLCKNNCDKSKNGCYLNRKVRNLGFTFHVGEDFRHLVSGLRHIDEVVSYFKFHAGDRIGHGIALGISPSEWSKDNKIVILPRIEYLENLLWIWGMYKDGEMIEDLDISYLEKKILKEAEKIYKNLRGIDVYTLWKAYDRKFEKFEVNDKFREPANIDGDIVDKSLFCYYVAEEQNRYWDDTKLLHAYHCKCFLLNMNEAIQIEIKENDVRIMEGIQKIIKKKIEKEGIVVETNPTSNRIIGGINNIFEHYITSLNKLDGNENILVTINTDDPCVFNTNINNEYSYIYYSLKEKGYSTEKILQWINKIRENAINSSFIQSRNISKDELKDEIKCIQKQLNNL